MDVKPVRIAIPDGANVIAGQTHFIKTVEDLYENFKTSVPTIKFGIGFCEASGDCLIRYDGNDDELVRSAVEAAKAVAAGHFFVAFIRDAFPINVLPALKTSGVVCNVLCATANPVQVLVAETDQGRGVVGVVDGYKPKGVEDDAAKKDRKEFLRKIGYKL